MKKLFAVLAILTLAIVMITGCGKNGDVKLLEKAKTYEENEQFDQAIASYEKLIKDYPDSPNCAEAMYRAGLVYTNGMQNFETAINTFSTVIDTFPQSPFAAHSQFMIGFIYANSLSDTVNAKVAYEAFLSKYPDNDLVPSVEWELQYLGKDINDIPELQQREEKEADK